MPVQAISGQADVEAEIPVAAGVAVPSANPAEAGIEAELKRDLGTGRAATIAAAHLDAGGRRIRARLALDLICATGVSRRAAMAAACSAELLHNASLVHDDIQDATSRRRGQPTIVARHGPEVALCVGDLLISAAWAALARLPADCLPAAMGCMHAAIAATCHGQIDDLTTARVDDEAAYQRIAARKSGPLLALPVQLIAILVGRGDLNNVITTVADTLAQGYQIEDDLADAAEDRRVGRPNLVCLYEDRGLSPAMARRLAVECAQAALAQARIDAAALPKALGSSLEALAVAMQTHNRAWAGDVA
ncbi:polyprenyl synthetase family protein [uncultured Salinisphaera sp.]|uniref:polyprenyl synthetase family protein n=1 Tax=uncultured Salinisphaera sp. TaxID=359372 RepID=UPI0032B1C57C